MSTSAPEIDPEESTEQFKEKIDSLGPIEASPSDHPALIEAWLRLGMTQEEIADRFDVTQSAISKAISRGPLDTATDYSESGNEYRPAKGDHFNWHTYTGDPAAYVKCKVPWPEDSSKSGWVHIARHQLVALTDHSIDDVFGTGEDGQRTVVHHRLNNGMALDFPENLEPMGNGEHFRKHLKEDHDADDVVKALGE